MSSAPAEPGPSLDRNPPQDIDAEKSVLGAMLSLSLIHISEPTRPY